MRVRNVNCKKGNAKIISTLEMCDWLYRKILHVLWTSYLVKILPFILHCTLYYFLDCTIRKQGNVASTTSIQSLTFQADEGSYPLEFGGQASAGCHENVSFLKRIRIHVALFKSERATHYATETSY